jgi:hypothetical protein
LLIRQFAHHIIIESTKLTNHNTTLYRHYASMEPKAIDFYAQLQRNLDIVPHQQVERLLRWLQNQNFFVPHIGLSYDSDNNT